jgi:hypothetical protein
MSLRRIALVASLVAASLSMVASPMLALAPEVGYRVTRAGPATPSGSIALHPWVWEPDASDALRIAVGPRTRRLVIRVWWVDGTWQGRLEERRRGAVGEPWRTVTRITLSAADLAGGSTDPRRTIYSRAGFLSFDAATLDIEDHGGLALTVVAPADRPLIVWFGARDEHTGRWSSVTRSVGR